MTQINQVGGTHYQENVGVCPHCGGDVQCWDFTAKMPFLVGSAIKYIVRFLSKDGFEGLKKAISYVEKMMAVYYPKEYAEWKHSAGSDPDVKRKAKDDTWPTYQSPYPSSLDGNCAKCGEPPRLHFGVYLQCRTRP